MWQFLNLKCSLLPSRHFIIAAGVANDPCLPKVRDDLRIVVDYFTNTLGYSHALPELMTSPTEPVFRSRLVAWFSASDRRSDDRVVLYFSGHGTVDNSDRHYLMLSDSDPKQVLLHA